MCPVAVCVCVTPPSLTDPFVPPGISGASGLCPWQIPAEALRKGGQTAYVLAPEDLGTWVMAASVLLEL